MSSIFINRTCLVLTVVAVVCTFMATTANAKGKKDRPNILFAFADDWGGGPHASCLGDPVVKTPNFDRVAREGVLFPYAYVASPSCTPSRGSILTGQAVHRLGTGGSLYGNLPVTLPVYSNMLEKAGYKVGHWRKAWGPGKTSEWGRNPAGDTYKSFPLFLDQLKEGQPFCFWYGSSDPHRGYRKGSGAKSGMKAADVAVPSWQPDTPEVRNDILDYYYEVQRFDSDLGKALELLKEKGLLDNTIVVVSGDNGMPFPRAKCNLYDSGTHVPLAVCWGKNITGGRTVNDFVSLSDLAPTFLEAAGVTIPDCMTAKSFMNVLQSDKDDRVDPARDFVVTERERHCDGRTDESGKYIKGDELSYPCRMIRTHDFLYIRNFRPELWPAGDPTIYTDVDSCPTKSEILTYKDDPKMKPFFDMAFGKRPAEELFDCRKDPGQIKNLADDPAYADVKKKLRSRLDKWMQQTDDPRAKGETNFWDKDPYKGGKPGPPKLFEKK